MILRLQPPLSLEQELQLRLASRRAFLRRGSLSLGAIAFHSLLGGPARARARARFRDLARPLVPKAPPLPARVKEVIYVHRSGAPPQHDLFDWKPNLVEHHLRPCPEELLADQRFAFIQVRPLFDQEKARLHADPTAAKALCEQPLGTLPARLDAVEVAAWVVVANVLLNLDSVLVKG